MKEKEIGDADRIDRKYGALSKRRAKTVKVTRSMIKVKLDATRRFLMYNKLYTTIRYVQVYLPLPTAYLSLQLLDPRFKLLVPLFQGSYGVPQSLFHVIIRSQQSLLSLDMFRYLIKGCESR